MTIREWLDVYTANGDAQLVCAWRKRAWRAMRPVVEKVAADLCAWTVGRAMLDIDAAAFAAKIKPDGKRWKQERELIEKVFNAERSLWRAPTDEDRGVVSVAFDLVEECRYDEAIALLLEQAPYALERPCPACGSPASWYCHEIGTDRTKPGEDSAQTAALRKAGMRRVWSRQSLIVPHESRVAP